ncbi:MAG: N-acyl amino acid synthase FeeM domain-containing protein [Rhizobiaceae bacterium]
MSTSSDLAEIERLRRASYENTTLFDINNFSALVDEDDVAPDCFVIGVFIDEQLVSTIRLHILTGERQHGPSATLFPALTNQLLENGTCIVDPSRFASDPASLWKYPSIPLLTLRAAAMALDYFSASHLVGVVREDGTSFYKRCFGGEAISDPIHVEGVTIPVMMLACPVEKIQEKTASRYPFFKSQPYERKLMFAPKEELAYPLLNILPTAKYAHMLSRHVTAATFPEVMPA